MSELPESVPLQIRAAGRYDRQARISWWDQSVLAASRVLVAGAGALGNEVAKNLVLLGVGSTVLVDMDTIEVSNLSRCLGFHPDDAGLHKAEVLARRLGALNPGVAVHGVVAPVQALGVGFARRATVMVGALDNREARRYLNRLAWASGTPWVDGAIGEMDGAVRIFRPPVSCYECTLDDADFADLAKRRSCRLLGENAPAEGVVPTSITTAAIVGGVQAQEAVKLIHQLAGLLPFSSQGSPNGFRFFGLSTDAYGELTPTADGCAAHDPHAGVRVRTQPLSTLRDLLGDDVDVNSAVVELGDDHLVAWDCRSCGTRTPDGRPVWRIAESDSACPACGSVRTPEVRASIPANHEAIAWPVDRWQLRPDDDLGVRTGMDTDYWWIRDDTVAPAGWS